MTTAILNQHFQSTLLGGGGGHTKEYAVYARENDDNYGRPLICFTCMCFDLYNCAVILYVEGSLFIDTHAKIVECIEYNGKPGHIDRNGIRFIRYNVLEPGKICH